MISKLMQWTCVLALSSFGLRAQSAAPPVAAGPHLRTFGMVGLVEGQTARLNLLNPGVSAAACTAAVAFLDGAGATLKSNTITVAPGTSQAYDLDSDADLKLAANERHEIRASIEIPAVIPPAGSTLPVAAPCRLIPTLEIFDSVSRRTTVILTRTHLVATPTPAAAGN